MDVICAVVSILLFLAIIVFLMLKFSCEEAPDYVELDEYYRNRWYK